MSELSDLEKVQYLMDAEADEIELDDYALKFLVAMEKQLLNHNPTEKQKTFLDNLWERL